MEATSLSTQGKCTSESLRVGKSDHSRPELLNPDVARKCGFELERFQNETVKERCKSRNSRLKMLVVNEERNGESTRIDVGRPPRGAGVLSLRSSSSVVGLCTFCSESAKNEDFEESGSVVSRFKWP